METTDPSRLTAEQTRFEKQGRFYPWLDSQIDTVFKHRKFSVVRKAHLKAYILCATGIQPYLQECCGAKAVRIIQAAAELQTTPATVAIVFGTHNDAGDEKICNFAVEPRAVDFARELSKTYGWEETTRVAMSTRCGLGLVRVSQALSNWRSQSELWFDFCQLRDSPTLQVYELAAQLNCEMEQKRTSFALACERVRHTLATSARGEFGHACYRELSRLIASGHDMS